MTAVGSTRHRLSRALVVPLILLTILSVAAFAAFKCSPWPSVLLIRREFNRDGIEGNAALSKRVPPGIRTQAAIQYDANDPNALLDIYRPAALDGHALPVVFWIHGGGYIVGSRTDISNYAFSLLMATPSSRWIIRWHRRTIIPCRSSRSIARSHFFPLTQRSYG
jgi:acetyl esterase/lipase